MDKLNKGTIKTAPSSSGTEIPTLNNPVAKNTGKKSSSGSILLALLSLIVAIAAVGAAYYLWMQQQQMDYRLQSVLQQADEKLQRSERSLDQLQLEVHQAALAHDKQQQGLQSEIAELQKHLSSQQHRLHLLSTTDRSEWKLAELEYLLRLANQRILVGGEIRGAEALLNAADKIVRELDDMALYSVRKSIASDLAAVRAVSELDVQGVYVRLLALAEQVDTLPLFNPPKNEQPTPAGQALLLAPGSDASWLEQSRYQLNVATQELIEMLGIRHRNYTVEPLLPPEEHFYLRKNIQLKFEQAKSALMAGQQQVYQQSLADAQAWLAKYYQLAGHSSQVALETLNELQKVEVIQSLPDISASLRAVKSYLAERYRVAGVQHDKTEKSKTVEQAVVNDNGGL